MFLNWSGLQLCAYISSWGEWAGVVGVVEGLKGSKAHGDWHVNGLIV
jgi:hypothetical protein